MKGHVISKIPVFVEICLADGSVFSGNMFVQNQSRLSDVLNDDRKFLPMHTIDGKLLAIAKTAIKHVMLPAACGSVGDSARHCRGPTHAILPEAGSVSLRNEKAATSTTLLLKESQGKDCAGSAGAYWGSAFKLSGRTTMRLSLVGGQPLNKS